MCVKVYTTYTCRTIQFVNRTQLEKRERKAEALRFVVIILYVSPQKKDATMRGVRVKVKEKV